MWEQRSCRYEAKPLQTGVVGQRIAQHLESQARRNPYSGVGATEKLARLGGCAGGLHQAVDRPVDVGTVDDSLDSDSREQARSEACVEERRAGSGTFCSDYVGEVGGGRNAEGEDPVSNGAYPPGGEVLGDGRGQGQDVAGRVFGLELVQAGVIRGGQGLLGGAAALDHANRGEDIVLGVSKATAVLVRAGVDGVAAVVVELDVVVGGGVGVGGRERCVGRLQLCVLGYR
jgi:hypothetical protein